MYLSFDRPFWALLFTLGILITIASCGGSSSGPNLNKLEIVSIIPDSGMVGDSVTIKGSGGFASRLSDNLLTFNGTPATVLSTTPDQLITRVPEGATSGRLTLEVNDQTVKGPHFKVLSFAPVITGVSPNQATPGTKVRIKGKHFLSGSASSNKTPHDLLPDNKQTKEPLAKTNAGNTSSIGAPGAKRPGMGMPSPKSDMPPSNNTSNIKVSSAHNKAHITATTTNTDAISITFGGQQAPVHSASDTLLVTEVPENAASGLIKVSVEDQTTTGPEFTVLQGLLITGINPNGGPVDTKVAISGQNFAAQKNDNTIQFNGTKGSIVSATQSELTAIVPTGATTGPVTVTVANQTVTGPTFTVSQNKPPIFTSNPNFSLEENSKSAGSVIAKDPEGTTISYTISGGQDQDLFTIEEQTGVLTFASTPDYENPGDANADNVYEVQVSASDGSLSASQDITITVTNVNENQAPSFTSSSSLTIDENITAVGTLTASDPEGDAITLSISGGTDQDLFNLDGQSGELSFKAAPDHEAPADGNSDNIYEVQVEAADNSGSTTQEITVNVQNLNDNSPVITKSTYEIDENKTEIGTIAASDPDGDALTYELNGGVDENFFILDAQTGALSFKNPPNYEEPTDGGSIGYPTDNEYEFSIVVRDGKSLDVKSILVIVKNVTEPPQFGSALIGSYGTGSSSNPYVFDPIPIGTDLTNNLQVSIYFEFGSERVSSATIGGTDANLFTSGGITRLYSGQYMLSVTGPANLDYNHNTDHHYEFTVTANTAADTSTTATFIIPVKPFNEGSGTQADPYKVTNLYQLQAIGQDKYLDAHFEQTQDIDASITANWNPVPPDPPLPTDPPRGFDPIGHHVFDDVQQIWLVHAFEGTYNGNGYNITGLTIQRLESAESRVGLFGVIGENGVVKNVHVDGYISADVSVGGLAGENSGTIENSSSSVDIVCFSGICGVLVGQNDVGGIIRDSFATANIDENSDTIG